MTDLNVLIVGAGIAGPTTAYWLSKAGAHVTIIERMPAIRIEGQNVDIRTIGVTIMNKMEDMEARVRSNLFALDGLSFVNKDGSPVATMTTTGNPEQQSVISEYEILRGDLNRILYDLTKDSPRIKYVFGEQVIAMHQKEEIDGPITVEFANGYPTATYDLVVACDGSTSRTRAIGLNCGVRDHIESMNCWTAYFSIERDLLNGSKNLYSYSTPGGRGYFLGPSPNEDEVRGGFMKTYPRGGRDGTSEFREARDQGDDALRQHASKLFADAGWKSDEIVQGMFRAKDFYANEWVQVKIPRLFKGRFTLVGDAGYAPGPTGNGTSLSIAGAYILAGEICRHKGDISAGLKAYEERMRPLIADMQVIPPAMPWFLTPQTEFGIWMRNIIFRVVCFGMSYQSWFSWFGGLYSSALGKDKWSDSLPDYEWVY